MVSRLTVFVVALWIPLLGLTSPLPAESARAFDRIGEVVEHWSPDQHLYLDGDVGLGAGQASSLESWLDANAPHWTVVLMRQAEDEQYQAADGRLYEGLDAVEYCLGYGLTNRTGFGELEHPRTKETDGAVFVLFLAERKFSYFGSEAQDRRGLGEANWIGDLDQPAFRAMRGGGRILDAVKDTVTSINQRLEQAIQAEVDAEERAKRERQRELENFAAAVAAQRDGLDQLAARTAEFVGRYPSAEGPLARPPFDEARNQLAAWQMEVNEENVRDYQQRIARQKQELDRFLNAHAELAHFAEQETELTAHAKELAQRAPRVAGEAAGRAQASLVEAKKALEAGNLEFSVDLRRAADAVTEAEQALEAETKRLQEAEQRALLVRRTAILVAGSMLAGLLVLLVVLNRRRAPARAKSIQAFAERESSVRQEMDHVVQLFSRSGEILGDRDRLAARGYEGETKSLSEQTLQYVDDLFVMSSEVKRVMEDAKAMIRPGNPWGWLVNLVSAAPFERGINHVTGKPLRFSRDKGLPLVLRELPGVLSGTGAAEESAAVGAATSAAAEEPESVALTFEQVFAAFRKRYQDAVDGLNRLETSLANIQDELKRFRDGIDRAIAADKQLAAATQADGYFAVPHFFETLLPSLQSDYAAADKLSGFDPVQAFRVPLANGLRKVEEGLRLAEMLTSFREKLFPQISIASTRLKELGYRPEWIDEHLGDLGERADELLVRAATGPIGAELDGLESQLEELRQRVQVAVEIGERIQVEWAPGLTALAARIAEVRGDIARKLGLPAERVLRELELEPDDFLARAEQNVQAARTMLQQGRTDSARAALDSMRIEVSRADSILVESTKGVNQFENLRDRLGHAAQQLEQGLATVQRDVQTASTQYAAAALQLTETKGVGEDVSAAMALDASQKQLREVHRLLELALNQQREAHVLKASSLLADADLAVSQGTERVGQVRAHLELLANQARENESTVARLESEREKLTQALQQPWIMRRTQEAARAWSNGIAEARVTVDDRSAAPNPFAVAKSLANLVGEQAKISARLAADREALDEATRAVAGADRQRQAALQMVRQSQSDRITDSPLTTDAVRRITSLDADFPGLQRRLRVPHEDWQAIDSAAAKLQADLSAVADVLRGELTAAENALGHFQQASQAVYRAAEWAGPWGLRISGSPGVNELEGARAALQAGDYSGGLRYSLAATAAATAAIEQAEREIARRKMEEARAAEAARRAREASRIPRIRPFGGGFPPFPSMPRSSSSGSSSRSSSSSGGGGSSGFRRSGW